MSTEIRIQLSSVAQLCVWLICDLCIEASSVEASICFQTY